MSETDATVTTQV